VHLLAFHLHIVVPGTAHQHWLWCRERERLEFCIVWSWKDWSFALFGVGKIGVLDCCFCVLSRVGDDAAPPPWEELVVWWWCYLGGSFVGKERCQGWCSFDCLYCSELLLLLFFSWRLGLWVLSFPFPCEPLGSAHCGSIACYVCVSRVPRLLLSLCLDGWVLCFLGG
jgi:hypothetical protein